MASILILDDEPIVLRLVKAVLNRSGHEVATAGMGEDARQAAEQMRHIDLLILDQGVRPQKRGTDIGDRLLTERPDLKILRMSGWPTPPEVKMELAPASNVGFLAKPFTAQKLRSAVSAALALTLSWIVEMA